MCTLAKEIPPRPGTPQTNEVTTKLCGFAGQLETYPSLKAGILLNAAEREEEKSCEETQGAI